MGEPDVAFPVDLDPDHRLVPGKRPIGAAAVGQYPVTVLDPERGMVPGHPLFVDHDLALRITADPVRRAPAGLVNAVSPHREQRRVPPRKGFPVNHALTVSEPGQSGIHLTWQPQAGRARDPAAEPRIRVPWVAAPSR